MSNITLFVISKSPVAEVPVKFITFSDGSETCEIDPLVFMGRTIDLISVSVEIKNVTRDLMRIALVKDALDNMGMCPSVKIQLNIPYMPQARADRRFKDGMAHPLKVAGKFINSLNFWNVYIEDPHSDVTEAVLDNVEIIPQQMIVNSQRNQWERMMPNAVLCAPDLGATKKIFDVVQALGKDRWVQAMKLRDVTTGNIVACDIVDKEVPEEVLIVDDIADGGASFKFLARKLRERGAKKVGLLVTHGIFKDGLPPLADDIDYIFAHNIIGDYINRMDISQFNTRGE